MQHTPAETGQGNAPVRFTIQYQAYGENHRSLMVFNTMHEAKTALAAFHADGWIARIVVEEVR